MAAPTIASPSATQTTTTGGDEQAGVSFYRDKAQGWFWYAIEPQPEDDEAEPPEPPPPPPPAPASPSKPETAPAPQGPAVFSAEWFRKNLPRYRDIAWDHPTRENVEAYLYLQRYVMDRSQDFADSFQRVTLGNPYLDENTRRPTSTAGSQSVDRVTAERRGELMKRIADKAGLFFFFKSNDPYSDLQASTVRMLERTLDFKVVPISIDGKPLSNGLYPDYRTDHGQARQLGIVSPPALFLVSGDGKIQPISQGVLSRSEAASRILLAAVQQGVVSDADLQSTRPYANAGLNLPETLEDGGSADWLAIKAANPDWAGDNFVPPEQLLRGIESRLGP